MVGAVSVLSLTPEATCRGKRIKSFIEVNRVFDLSTVLAHNSANDYFCTVNKTIFLEI